MAKGQGVADSQKRVRQFYVVGRALPSEKIPEPECYRMRVFAKDQVRARSKFWYFMKRQHKVRKCQGEVVSTSEIFEKNATCIKNYGIFFRYLTRTDTVNMYKEFRSNTICGAVSQLYTELAGKHSGRGETVQIIRTKVINKLAVPGEESDKPTLRRENTIAFVDGEKKFPQTDRRKRAPIAAYRSVFRANRPTLF
jgi:large subunit ribosomal protein L18Ae